MTDKTKVPPNWKSFLRENDNKTELFGFLAPLIVTLCPDNVVIVTIEENVLCNKPNILEGLGPCNHEEVDTRIFLHALHAAEQHNKSVLIKACDTYPCYYNQCFGGSSGCKLRGAVD